MTWLLGREFSEDRDSAKARSIAAIKSILKAAEDARAIRKSTLTQAKLKSHLHYDPSTGLFTRLIPTEVELAGESAGKVLSSGYVGIMVDGRRYYAHRLAWLYMTGEWPNPMIDHINTNRSDNSFDNLREANSKINQQNRRSPGKKNTSGYLGVSFHRQAGKFQARITVDGKLKSLGLFDSAEAASEGYVKAKRALHRGCTL